MSMPSTRSRTRANWRRRGLKLHANYSCHRDCGGLDGEDEMAGDEDSVIVTVSILARRHRCTFA